MTLSYTSRAAVPPDVLLQHLEGETVFLDLAGGKYFGLDPVGSRMWQVLTSSPSIQAAYDALLAEYDVSPDELRRDLEELVGKLVAAGLLELRDA